MCIKSKTHPVYKAVKLTETKVMEKKNNNDLGENRRKRMKYT